MNKVYTCPGSCHGVATEEQFQSGATTCGAQTCERHGQPLEARVQCQGCATAGPNHVCENCTKPE